MPLLGNIIDTIKMGLLVRKDKEIMEPLNTEEAIEKRLERFPEEVYLHSRNTHLFRFLVALCGEAGAGSLKRDYLYARLQQFLDTTHFQDLDKLYGNPLHLPRIREELYTYNPHSETLTQEQWQEVKTKDSMYRARCMTWAKAIMHGPTLRGIALAAEAATGFRCDVFERYKYLENQNSDEPINIPNIGKTNSRNEFVIIPRVPSITDEEVRRILRLVDHLKPQNTIVTVYRDSDRLTSERAILNVESSSDYWTVLRMIKGREDVDWPEIDLANGLWIEPGVEKEAPVFAFMERQETATYLSIKNVSASSEKIGEFNKMQKSLFGHLATTPTEGSVAPDYVYSANKSYFKSYVQLHTSSPWIRRNS